MTVAIKSTFPLLDSIDLKKYGSELFWVATGQALALVGNLGAIKILIGVMGVDGYGELALGMTLAGFQNLLIYGPLGQYILRYFGIYAQKGMLPQFYRYARSLHGAIAGITVLPALIISSGLLLLSLERWVAVVCISLLFGTMSGIGTTLLSVHNALRNRKIVALHQGADVWVRTGFAFALTYLVAPWASAAVLGYCAGSAVINVSQWVCLARSDAHPVSRKTGSVEKNDLKSMRRDFLSFGAPFIYFSVFSIISSYGDRWFVQGFCGLKEVGTYTVLFQLANAPINIIMAVVSQLMLPILYDKAGASLHETDVRRSTRFLYHAFSITAMFMCAVFVAALLCGRDMVALLSSSEIAGHMFLFLMIMGASIVFNLGQLLTARGMLQNRSDIYIMPKGIQAAAVIVSALFFVKIYGLPGMGISLLLSSFLYLFAVTLINRCRLT